MKKQIIYYLHANQVVTAIFLCGDGAQVDC
ncbi:Protein of unknown function [Leuconostoc citreum LBAE C11]|nr:Protein of unknown function [Leuconostoc citreum LBAE C11]